MEIYSSHTQPTSVAGFLTCTICSVDTKAVL